MKGADLEASGGLAGTARLGTQQRWPAKLRMADHMVTHFLGWPLPQSMESPDVRNLMAELIETGDPHFPFTVIVTHRGEKITSKRVLSRITGEAMVDAIKAIASNSRIEFD